MFPHERTEIKQVEVPVILTFLINLDHKSHSIVLKIYNITRNSLALYYYFYFFTIKKLQLLPQYISISYNLILLNNLFIVWLYNWPTKAQTFNSHINLSCQAFQVLLRVTSVNIVDKQKILILFHSLALFHFRWWNLLILFVQVHPLTS